MLLRRNAASGRAAPRPQRPCHIARHVKGPPPDRRRSARKPFCGARPRARTQGIASALPSARAQHQRAGTPSACERPAHCAFLSLPTPPLPSAKGPSIGSPLGIPRPEGSPPLALHRIAIVPRASRFAVRAPVRAPTARNRQSHWLAPRTNLSLQQKAQQKAPPLGKNFSRSTLAPSHGI